jgi:tetratricopeptide (TPR) repeat protein
LDLAVGFAYYRAYIFTGGFSLWNWRGRYVLFDGDNVFDLQQGEPEQLLGAQAASQLRVPLLYRIPVGLVTILLLGIALGIAIYFGSRKIEVVQKLAADPRFQAALEVHHAALPPAEEQTTREHRRAALQTAIEFMETEHKVPLADAQTKVRGLVAAVDESRSKDLRYQASLHEQAGEWDEALDLYEEAAELRELWDEKDYAYLLKCIARVEKKQASG